MRQLGVRLGITIVIGLVATVGVLGGPADARSRRHHRHHHHAGGGDGGSTPTPTAGLCAATPQTATLNLSGAFVTSVACHGLAPLQTLQIDSFLLRGNCGAVTIQGAVPPVALASDGGGNLSFSIAGSNCLAGNYSVQGFGSFDNIEFPVSLTF